MPRWTRFFIPFILFLSILSFQNCSKVSFSLDASSDQKQTDNGNGGVYEGKPGTYYRYVPDFACQGTAATYSSIEIQDMSATLVFNYASQCGVTKGPVPLESLQIVSLNGAVIGYRDGIYEYSDVPVGPANPWKNPVESLCESLSPLANQVESLVRVDSPDSIFQSQVFVKSPAGDLQVSNFSSLQRNVNLPKIHYSSAEFDLKVDVDQNIPRELNIFSGSLRFQGKSGEQNIAMSCRTGSVLDPVSILPAPGTLSQSFGVNGKVSIPNLVSGTDIPQMIELQNQKMLIAMNRFSDGNFNLLRLLPDGTPDSTFGTGGWARIPVGGSSSISTVKELPDRRLLIAGSANGDGALVRLNEDGSLDATFGTGGGGKVLQDFGGSSDEFQNIQIQTDGKILVTGVWGSNISGLFAAAARYDSSGNLDTTFGFSGLQKLPYAEGVGGRLTPSGQILVSSQVNSQGQSNKGFGFVGLTSNGQVDLSFGASGTGVAGFDFQFSEQSMAQITVQPDGKIILAGRVNSDYGLVRFLENGQVDPTFAGGKGVVTDSYLSDYLHDVVLQPDGKMIVLGGHDGVGPEIIRLDDNGQRDYGFGNGVPVNPNGSNNVTLPSDVKEPKSGYITSQGKLRFAVMQSDGQIAIIELNL